MNYNNLLNVGEGTAVPAPTDQADQAIDTRAPGSSFNFTDGCFVYESAYDLCRREVQFRAPKELWHSLWFEGETACLFSDSNLGKSIYAVQIAIELARHEPVIYYDFELSGKQFQSRYTDPDGNIYPFPSNLIRAHIDARCINDAIHYDSLDKLILSGAQRVGARIIIIDNLTFLCNESENGVAAMDLMTKLSEMKHAHGLSLLVLAHTPKRDLKNPLTTNDLAGSKRLFNFFDSVFALGKSTQAENRRYVKQLKARQCSIAYGQDNVMVLDIMKGDDGLLQMVTVGHDDERVHLKPTRHSDFFTSYAAKVQELTAMNLSVREIAEKLKIGKSSVSKIQNELRHTYIEPLGL